MFPRYETELDYKKFDIYVTGKLKTCFSRLEQNSTNIYKNQTYVPI